MSVATELQRIIDAKADLKTAIEAKGVTVSSDALIDDYADYVDSIPSGGGAVEEKLLNFIDFNGIIVASYDGSEIAGLSSLPNAPDHSTDEVPLTFDEWNWTLAEIQSYHTSHPEAKIWVGANYHTTDGKNHFFFSLTTDKDGNGVEIELQGHSANDTVDWGDGSAVETITSNTLSHIYTAVGEFHCIIDSSSTYYNVGGSSSTRRGKRDKLSKAFLSNTVTRLDSYAFRDCYSLQSITIPSSVTQIAIYPFEDCYSLKSITIPSGVTSINSTAFQNCYSLQSITVPSGVTNITLTTCPALKSITIPGGVTSIAGSMFANCFSLQSVVIPGGVTSISNYAFEKCYSLQSVVIPSGVTSLGGSAFQNCYSLQSITIPSGVTDIGSSAFYNCPSMYSVTILATTPPTLGSSNFSSFQKKIYVPYSADHSVLTAYQNATNWSNYASIMEELPE